jgi:hypothetical protein
MLRKSKITQQINRDGILDDLLSEMNQEGSKPSEVNETKSEKN